MVATSSPPTWLKQLSPSDSSETNFSTVYFANRVIDFDGLVWKTSPGAWDVEPPGRSSGPCSTTVISVQPSETSSSARLVPTMPAPMMTTRGADSMV